MSWTIHATGHTTSDEAEFEKLRTAFRRIVAVLDDEGANVTSAYMETNSGRVGLVEARTPSPVKVSEEGTG